MDAKSSQKELPFIKIAAHNIQSGWQNWLEMAVWELSQMNVNISILMEAKLTGGACTQCCLDCHVLANEAMSPHKSEVALVWRDRPNWTIKSQKIVGPNVLSFELKIGRQHFLCISACVSPSEVDGITTAWILTIREQCRGFQIVLLGNFNICLIELGLGSQKAPDITATFASIWVKNVSENFHWNCKHCDGFTWKTCCRGKLVGSRCDSILTDSWHNFTNVQIHMLRSLLLNHGVLYAWILADPTKTIKSCLWACETIPWSLLGKPSDEPNHGVSLQVSWSVNTQILAKQPLDLWQKLEIGEWASKYEEVQSPTCRYCSNAIMHSQLSKEGQQGPCGKSGWCHQSSFGGQWTARSLEHCQGLVPPSPKAYVLSVQTKLCQADSRASDTAHSRATTQCSCSSLPWCSI